MVRRHARLPRQRRAERGFIVLYAAFGVFLMAALILEGSRRQQTLEDVTSLEFGAEAQARRVAESGLIDALSWLRRQAEQPVKAFAPRRDLTRDPVLDETDDPARGLVRSFEIAPGHWAQYVVRPGRTAEAFTDANRNGIYDLGESFEDDDGDGRRDVGEGARDVSRRVPGAAQGSVWLLECEGRIFRRPRADLALGVEPNRQIAMSLVATEVRRHGVALPASAALLIGEARKLDFEEGLISSPILGVAHRADTGRIGGSGVILAPTATAPVPAWGSGGSGGLTPEDVFGLDLDALKAMADVVSAGPGEPGASPGTTVPDDALVVMTPWEDPSKKKSKGTITFTKDSPLSGRGILVVDGDVVIRKDALSDFDGILYVTGKLTADQRMQIRGTVIVGSEAKLTGPAPKGADGSALIEHDPDLVGRMLGSLSEYRRVRPFYAVAPMDPDERPREDLLLRRRQNAAGAP